jgi:Ser/Thr protein kinase RdoA (MazF antagonist)
MSVHMMGLAVAETDATIAGLRKIAEGREAEMFEWEDGRILRLYRGGFARSSADFQTQALEAARSAGVRVPEVFGTVEVDGRLGIVMERLDGVDLLTLIGQKPWRVWWVGGVTGRAHAALNLAEAPRALRSAHDRLRYILTTSERVPRHPRDAALARLQELPEGDRLLHGDFHPGNVMVHEGEAVVFDWSNAMRGDPEADLARTLLILKLGDPPPGTALHLRALAKVGRKLLIGAYRRTYRSVRQPDERLLRQWELPVAIARLADGIEQERPALLKYIKQRL